MEMAMKNKPLLAVETVSSEVLGAQFQLIPALAKSTR